jgi:hypothetical protein
MKRISVLLIMFCVITLVGCGGAGRKQSTEVITWNEEIGAFVGGKLSSEMEGKLNQKVTFDFLEIPLKEVMKKLSAQTGLKIKADAEVFKRKREVILRVDNMRFWAAINWVARVTDLDLEIRGNVIFFKKEVFGEVVEKIYDISEFEYKKEGTKPYEQAIRDSIEGSIYSEIWEEDKHFIRIKPGKLVIAAPGNVHKYIKQLFEDMKSRSVLPVDVNVDFLELDKKIKEELEKEIK